MFAISQALYAGVFPSRWQLRSWMAYPLLAFVFAFGVGCQSSPDSETHLQSEPQRGVLEGRLHSIASGYAQKYSAVPGVLIYVQSADLSVSQAAAGFRDPATQSKLKPTDQFRTASIAKMFIGATIMRLHEEKKLNLEDRIAKYLPENLLNGMARFQGVDYGREITVEQCLRHTSGLWDCFSDGSHDAHGHSPLEAELDRDPNKFWTSRDVIDWCKPRLEAVGPPGARFHYSDTGFQLLGLVIEKITEQPLARAVRSIVLEPLHMKNTYAEFREKKRSSPGIEIAHTFEGKTDRTGLLSESADWAGGGWITTAPDLTRFLRGISGNQFFRHPETWKAMQQWSSQSEGRYGLALNHHTTSANDQLVGHNGFYGSLAAYWPVQNTTIVVTMNQSSPASNVDHSEVLKNMLNQICDAVRGGINLDHE